MRIGYACKCEEVPGTRQRTCIAAKATEEYLNELIAFNLEALDTIFEYNNENDIRLFRISSDIIPFGSSPVNQLDWQRIFGKQLKCLGDKALSYGMRLSMHPGQYTVLNSPDDGVVLRAVDDLVYHCAFLDALGLPPEHKLILHIGGVYKDKPQAVVRFCENYRQLPAAVQARLVIENDERSYNIEEVLAIGRAENIPVVFDNLHHAINQPGGGRSEMEWLKLCGTTWQAADGCQKIHYAQQAEGKRTGAHSTTIDTAVFAEFVSRLQDDRIDIMLEVKDKNLSALKCIEYFKSFSSIF